MANRKQDKECIDIRICIDQDAYKAVVKYQAARVAKDGISYQRWEAASDLFNELVRKYVAK